MDFQQTSRNSAKNLISLLLKGEKIEVWGSEWYSFPRLGLEESGKTWHTTTVPTHYTMCSALDHRKWFDEVKWLELTNGSYREFKVDEIPKNWCFSPDVIEFIKGCYAFDEEGYIFLTLPSVVEDRMKQESFFKSVNLDRLKEKTPAFLNAEGYTQKEIDWIKGYAKAA